MFQSKRSSIRSAKLEPEKNKKTREELNVMIKTMQKGAKELSKYFALKLEEEREAKEKRQKQAETPQIKSYLGNPTKNRTGTEHCLEKFRFVLDDTLPGDYIHATCISREIVETATSDETYEALMQTRPKAMKAPLYIATQAPKMETVVDFWRMAWQSKSRLIVSLTNPKDLEKGQTTCYWPLSPNVIYRFGPIMVRNMAYREEESWVETLLELAFSGEGIRRRITHLMYADWDDKRVPLTGRSLTAFRHKMRDTMKSPMKLAREESSEDLEKGQGASLSNRQEDMTEEQWPVIVQCSTAAGRTGALIVLDMSMEDMEKIRDHDTLETNLDLVREQLPGAVQTQNQFISIYLANMIHGMRNNPDLKMEDFKLFAPIAPKQE